MIERSERTVEAGDGTRLWARRTAGPDATGTPLICANGIGVGTFFWHYLEDHYAETRPVIVWDYRGHGHSEFPRDLGQLRIEDNAEDLRRVLDAFEVERAVLLGHSMGCQVIYTVAHQAPDRVAGLVPMLGTHGKPVHTFLDRPTSSLIGFMLSHWVSVRIPTLLEKTKRKIFTHHPSRRFLSGLARLGGVVHPTSMQQSDLDLYLDHFAELSPLVFFRMAEHMATHSAESYLPQIEAPTLVVAGERDLFTPLWLSEEIVDRLPHAELLVLPEGSHAALVEQPQRIYARLDQFLAHHGVL